MHKRRILAPLFAIVLFFAFACSTVRAPGSWEPLQPGVGDGFTIANFVDENTGWIMGVTDRTYQPPEENANSNTAIVPKKPEKPTDKKPEDPLKANQGFEVLQTTDGGTTWKQLPNQFQNKIRSVWFVDPSNGWALTIDRNILHTADGGTTWTLQRKAGTIKLKLFGNRKQPVMDQPEQLTGIYFVDPLHGWSWGGGRKDQYTEQPGTFLTTNDGGQSWNELPFPFAQDVWSIFFLNVSLAWASDRDGGFYQTTDGGLNWTLRPGKMPELSFDSIFFLDGTYGWVAGRSGRLFKTIDGGRTWKRIISIRTEFKLRDIAFIDRDHGWAVGDSGAILYTADGGESWVDSSLPEMGDLKDVKLVGKAGWVVGLSGSVLRYQAAGTKE